ncbi:hypothetical protein AGLY_017723 [Aphis glycines]|uniref:DUF4371 domain-containing protein n=1 Tax=Aphis glycines TaxID=307491 RepID=A0A6G0SU63_APHGL|nr:hypothetical protein AGLY_017723 [Aphis glycines]
MCPQDTTWFGLWVITSHKCSPYVMGVNPITPSSFVNSVECPVDLYTNFTSTESRSSQSFETILGQSESVISTTQINYNQNESQFKSKNITTDQAVSNNERKLVSLSPCIDELTSTFSKFENDKGLYENCSKLNEDKIRALLLAGPCQPKECDFPWLSYSPTKHYAYFHYCWLFGDEAEKRSAWYTGFTTWKHFYQSSMRHGLSKVHLNNAVTATTFLQKSDIHHKLNKQINEEAKKWTTILNIIFDTVRTLSGLGVAFRGHRENILSDDYPGIYLTIIKLISRHNPILFSHIESSNRIKYLSKTIMYELLSTLADQTRKIIVDECKDAKFFTLLADSTTDVAHLNQMAILLRYVLIQKEDKDTPKIYRKKSFLLWTRKETFVYDGAAVMAGKQGGLQAKIKEFVGNETFAPYIHCAAHQVNLVLVHAVEENTSSSIKVFFMNIQTVFNYFAHSHRRWEAFLDESCRSSSNPNSFGIQLLKALKKEMFNKEIENDALDAQNNKPRELHIKSLSKTQVRVAASGDDIMAAHTLLSSINWLFLFNLLWWHSVLDIINFAQLQLQKKEIDLIMAQNCISTALTKLQDLRNEKSYNNFMTKAKTNWKKMVTDSSLETSDKHRISYYDVFDTMCSELQERATGFRGINEVFGFLMPENLQKLKEGDLDINNGNVLDSEIAFSSGSAACLKSGSYKPGLLHKIGINRTSRLTPKCKSLYKDGLKLQKLLYRERRKCNSFKERLKSASNFFNTHDSDQMTTAAKIFAKLQLRETKN